MITFSGLPRQKLSWRNKNREWRKKHADWAVDNIWSSDSPIRKPLKNKLINYNLINGILDLSDFALILNPNKQTASFIPDDIQHYSILNSKINILVGEEASRRFDYRLIITNPEEISEIENNKKEAWMEDLFYWATADSESEEDAERDLEKITQYNKYEWQDIREIRGNAILKHYIAELGIKAKFNKGFYNAQWSGEEVYQCDIVGGEPTFEVVNPNKMVVLKSGSSSRIEDADMIVLWDYKSPGQIIDQYYDVLTDKDIKYIDELPFSGDTDDLDNEDPRSHFKFTSIGSVSYGDGLMLPDSPFDVDNHLGNGITDGFGNIREVRIYWKSYRRILKVKSYNFETGEEEYNFYPETYKINTDLGEEADTLWINEAWEATKIGDIYVNMRPRVVQYNRLTNPSRCHFGIVGSTYSFNDGKPFTLVDIGKPYNYLYDVVHDRLNKHLASNWGKIIKLDFSLVPKGWEIDKWLYYAKANNVAVIDSFKEGNKGASTGKLAGMLNNQSSGVIDADQGNIIQNDIMLLEFIKAEMGEAMGITPQREGQITNRETVGGVERAVLQSSHITEWMFTIHDDIRKRALEAFLETAKIAFKGKKIKFPYILGDGSIKVMDIDGDEFAECDYGLVLDNSNETENFLQKLEAFVQPLIQNQMITTSTLIKLWNGSSIADITRSVEEDERNANEQRAQEARAKQEEYQAELMARAELESEKLRIEEESNIRDNETKIILEHIKQSASQEVDENKYVIDPAKQEEMREKIRQFNNNLTLNKDKLSEDKRKNKANESIKRQELAIKRKIASKPNSSPSKK